MISDIWNKIASKWYIVDYNSQNDSEIERELDKNCGIFNKIIKLNNECDWDKDDDLGF